MQCEGQLVSILQASFKSFSSPIELPKLYVIRLVVPSRQLQSVIPQRATVSLTNSLIFLTWGCRREIAKTYIVFEIATIIFQHLYKLKTSALASARADQMIQVGGSIFYLTPNHCWGKWDFDCFRGTENLRSLRGRLLQSILSLSSNPIQDATKASSPTSSKTSSLHPTVLLTDCHKSRTPSKQQCHSTQLCWTQYSFPTGSKKINQRSIAPRACGIHDKFQEQVGKYLKPVNARKPLVEEERRITEEEDLRDYIDYPWPPKLRGNSGMPMSFEECFRNVLWKLFRLMMPVRMLIKTSFLVTEVILSGSS